MNAKSLLPSRPGAYASNSGGFMLADVLAAVTVSLLLILPALCLTAQTEQIYSRGQIVHQAVLAAREEIESVTEPPGTAGEHYFGGRRYWVRHSWQDGPEGLLRHQVEVGDEKETICTLVRLCQPPAP